MKKLAHSTIGNLLGVYIEMDYYEASEYKCERYHHNYYSYPDFYNEKNKENMLQIKEFAKNLDWSWK